MINGYQHILPNIHTEKYQRLNETTISILFNMGFKTVGNIKICGAKATFLLFCDHQDTKSD